MSNEFSVDFWLRLLDGRTKRLAEWISLGVPQNIIDAERVLVAKAQQGLAEAQARETTDT